MAKQAIVESQNENQEPVNFQDGLLSVIERAAINPDVDVDKMERLFALQERLLDRQAKADFTAAKIAMQPHLPSITMKGKIVILDKHDKTKVIQSTPFARFEDIHEAVMPVLQEYGFDLKFKNTSTDSGKPVVTTILEHLGGYSEQTEFELPMDSSGSKNNIQAVGSSTSYGKRYGTLSILNLRVHGEDDDAQTMSKEFVEADKPFVTGPAKNKTELKKLSRAFGLEISDITDTDTLDIFLGSKASQELIAQMQTNLPLWWSGDGDQKGVAGVIQQKRDELDLKGV